jgi:predicted dienelactone hydrolase
MRQLLITVLLLSACFAFGQAPSIDTFTLHFYDSARNRKLTTDIWRSSKDTGGLKPLVLVSHGTGGNRQSLAWFCAGLAKSGFVVAAVDHFGNTFDNPIPREFVTFWQRPLDISFILTQMLNQKTFPVKIDRRNIFAAGFSLGGYTGLALAGARLDWDALMKFIETPQGKQAVNIPEMPGLINLLKDKDIIEAAKQAPDLKDPRIKAVFTMAPALGPGFVSDTQMRQVHIPVFIVGAKADSMATVATNAAHYKKLLPDAGYYLTESNAGHYVFLNEGSEDLKKQAPIFFKDAEGVDRRQVHDKVVELALQFFKSNLSD